MSDKYDSLIEENTQLKKALITSKSVIDKIQNDYDTLKSIYEDTRLHSDRAKREVQDLSTKVSSLQADKRDLEQQFDVTIRNLKLAIEQKQREIEEIQQKIIPTFDQDMVRIRIINELEIPHRQQLEQKQLEIEKLQESVYHLKRQIDLAQAKAETVQIEAQKEQKIYQEKFKIEKQELQRHIDELQGLVEDNKERDNTRKIKKELDELKLRYQACFTENEDLRQERDKTKEEKNDLMIKVARQIDQERNEKRQFKSEAEKLIVRLRFIEDEYRKEKIRREQILSEMELIKSEKDSLLAEIRKKDDTIHYLQRKITQMEEENLQNEQKTHDHVKNVYQLILKMLKLYNEEHDKYLQERNKAVIVLKDFDTLKKRFSDQSDDYKNLKERYLKETSDLKDEFRGSSEEREKLRRQVVTLTKEVDELQKQVKMKEEQIRDIDQDYETIKKRNREITHRLTLVETQAYNTQTYTKPVSQPSPPQLKATKVRFMQEEENYDQHQNIQEFQKTIQKLQEENQKLSNQVRKLKDKLKQANEKIMSLLNQKLQEKKQETRENYLAPHFNQQFDTLPQSHSTYQQQYSGPNQELDDDQILMQIKVLTAQAEQERTRQNWKM